MKIKRTVDGISPHDSARLKKKKEAEAEEAGKQQAGATQIDLTGRVNLDLSREINRLLVIDPEEDENRRKKVAELKERYESGKLSYDSEQVAGAFLREITEL